MAQAQPYLGRAAQYGADFWQKLGALEMPTQGEYADALVSMNVLAAMVLIICGTVYLLRGWKAFKMLVLINAALLGGFVGNQVGRLANGGNMPLLGGIAGGLLFAVLAWPMMKFAISLMGGLVGGLIGYGVWIYAAEIANKPYLAENAWAGALIGMILLGLLGLLVFRLVIMIFTSFQGSLMVVSGACAVLMRLNFLQPKLHSAISNNLHLLMLLIGVPALIGFALQYTAMSTKVRKKRKAMEGGG